MTDFTKPGYYRTRGDHKVYVMGVNPVGEETYHPIIGVDSQGLVETWTLDGALFIGEGDSDEDLIAPWFEGVTLELKSKDEIFIGRYGIDEVPDDKKVSFIKNDDEDYMIRFVRDRINHGFHISAAYHDGENHVVWMERSDK